MNVASKGEKPLLLVVNPASGRGAARKKLHDIVRVFARKGFAVTVYPTSRRGTARYVSANIGRYERVVCCGGDGTLSEVLAGAAASGSKTPIAHIPAGTTDDFARSLRLPKDLLLAAERAAGDNFMSFDTGSLNGRHFAYIAAAGAFTAVSYKTPQYLKNLFGHFAYVLEGAKSLPDIRTFALEADFGGQSAGGDFIFVSLSNTLSVGGMVRLKSESVNFGDGAFELLLIRKPGNISDAATLVSDILSGRTENKNIIFAQVGSADLRFAKPMVFTLDGERGEALTRAELRVAKDSVVLVV